MKESRFEEKSAMSLLTERCGLNRRESSQKEGVHPQRPQTELVIILSKFNNPFDNVSNLLNYRKSMAKNQIKF